jgi:eukaryotic-like serine/threonine-protein kinase
MKELLIKIFKAENYLDLLRHLSIMALLVAILLLVFFYLFLPSVTNHGESITVPDITGLSYEDLNEFLTERNLRYEVNADSGYSAEYPPLTVLKQHPEGGQKVKQDRVIYITLNAEHPPNIKMPRLVEGSLKNAEIVLESYGLVRGKIMYKPDPAQNAVLEQLYNGKPIPEGALISKGSQIDLVVGDGLGKQVFTMPDLVGMQLDEAKIMIIGSGLHLGNIEYVPTGESKPGKVMSQQPSAGTSVKIDNTVDLWVTEQGAESSPDK